jgi:DNA polymerase III subunit gamma/tau
MSYLVLARKYRPTTFSEVVGQEHVTRTLGNAFATGRVHHAFLFCGPRGCGKTTLARIVGKALNCQQQDPPVLVCGVCSACTSISNGSAVDYQELDGASNRGIDAIRELTEAVRYQPAVLRKKVYVIDEVHMLTTEAFNALLKTLEEPPPHVTFVLATTEPHKLPNTILSRCQRYDFKLVPASRLAQHLTRIFEQERLPIEAGAVGLLVRESGGSVRDALSLCDQIISYVGAGETITERHVAEVLGVADRSLTRSLVRALAAGDAGAALAAVESAIERGVDEVQLARAIVRYLRDLSVLQVAPGHPELVDATDEERADLLAESRELDRSRVTQMFDRMLRCCDELGKTLQPRLVLDCALIDVATVEPLVPLGDLIERLGELEARLAGKGAGGPAAGASRPAPGGGSRGGPPARAAGAGTGPGRSGPAPAPAPSAPPASRAAPAPAPSAPAPAPAPAPPASRAAPAASAPPAPAPRAEAAPALRAEAAPAPSPAARGAPAGPAAVEAERTSAVPAPVAAPPSRPAMQPSVRPTEPVPQPPPVAAGSGPHPHDDRPLPAPTMGVPTTPEDVLSAWSAVLAQLAARGRISLSPFEYARVLRWTKDALDLGFPVDSHGMGEMVNERDKIEELRTLIRELVPEMKSMKLSVRLLDAAESEQVGPRSVLETSAARGLAERTKREAEAREHPITRHVLQAFGAQIKEIKTDV